MAYFTLRPLSLREFVIFHLSVQKRVSDNNFFLATFEKKILARTEDLIGFVGRFKVRTVKLIHKTVRAHLQRLSRGTGHPFNDSIFYPISNLDVSAGTWA